MKKTKIITLMLLCGYLALCLTGCGSDAEMEKLKSENAQLKEQLGATSDETGNSTEIVSEATTMPTETLIPAATPAPTVKKLTKKEKYEQYAKQVKI